MTFPHPDIASVDAKKAHSFDRVCPVPNCRHAMHRWSQSGMHTRMEMQKQWGHFKTFDLSRLQPKKVPALRSLEEVMDKILTSSSIRQE